MPFKNFFLAFDIGPGNCLIDKWIYANSSHTIDLLRFFGGEFQKVHTLKNSENHTFYK